MYAMSLTYPQKVTLYQVGDLTEGASFNNFLDGIDASYCTYLGGNDPTQDGIYPDPAPAGPGVYKGPEDCGRYAPSSVFSISYSFNEADLSPFYTTRQCNEYMKLGLQGVTVLYSSGDYGVAGNGNQCIDRTTGAYNDGENNFSVIKEKHEKLTECKGKDGRFNPSFPGTCPCKFSSKLVDRALYLLISRRHLRRRNPNSSRSYRNTTRDRR